MDIRYMSNVLRWILRGLLIVINNLYVLPTYCVWMYLLSPIKIISEDMFWKIEGQCFYWLLSMVGFWSYSAGYNILETGDDIDAIINEECMVLVNHQSSSDVLLLMAAFSTRNGLLQNLNWVMDSIFKYTHFGIVSIIHGDFYIPAGRDKLQATIILLKEYLKNIYITRRRKWIVLFPEGGFLRKRREAGHRYARRLNLPLLNHVTLPRLGAIQAIMDTIGPQSVENGTPNTGKEHTVGKLKYIIDITIAYPNGRPLDMGSIVFGYDEACDVRMHYRTFPIEGVPSDSEQLQEWTYRRYEEKESLLDYYYKTGIWEPQAMELNQSVSTYHSTTNMNVKLLEQNDNTANDELPSVLENQTGVKLDSAAPSVPKTLYPPENVETGKVSFASQTEVVKEKLEEDSVQDNSSIVEILSTNELPSVLENQTGVKLDSAAPSVPKTVYPPQNVESGKVSVASQTEVVKEKLEEDSVQDNSSIVEILSTGVEFCRVNRQDLLEIGMVHAGFICSSVFHYYALIWFFNVTTKHLYE